MTCKRENFVSFIAFKGMQYQEFKANAMRPNRILLLSRTDKISVPTVVLGAPVEETKI